MIREARLFPGEGPTQDLESWWMETSETDVQACIPKLHEYGSDDLLAIGSDLAVMADWSDAPDRVKAEMGCAFYLRGKVARHMTAYKAHRLPSDDTLHDDTVYSMMMRRIRAVGEWR